MNEETTTATAEPEAPDTPEAPETEEPKSRKAQAMDLVRKREAEAEEEPKPEPEPEPQPAVAEEPEAEVEEPAEEPEEPTEATITRWRHPETKKWVKKGTPGAEAVEVKVSTKEEEEVEEAPDVEGEAERPAAEEPRETEETEEAPEPEAEPILVEGPGREDGETAQVDISALPEEQQDFVRQWANNGMRRNEFHRQEAALAQERSEYEEFQEILSNRPAALVTHMADDVKRDMALALLSDDAVYSEISDTIEEWGYDPSKRLAAENERLRNERREEAERQKKAQLQKRFAAIEEKVVDLVPESADNETAKLFYRDAIRDIEDHIRSERKIIDPSEVEEIIERRLSQYGFDNGSEPSEPAASKTPSSPARDPESGERPAGGEDSPDPVTKRRKLATTPAGAGAAGSTGIKVPKDITLKDSKGFIREHFGIG